MSRSRFPRRLLVIGLLAAGLFSGAVFGAAGHGDLGANRAKLLSYLLRQQLTANHYSHKAIDDDFSRAAFDLYLKQLDGQKRFLLQEDIRQLKAYATRIDDEINQGRILLPAVGGKLLNTRVIQARATVRDLLARDFDFRRKEEIETDPEKIDYCADSRQLRERWRKTLKLQVLSRYLDMEEDRRAEAAAKGSGKKPSPPVTQAAAREKVLKSYETFFARFLEESDQDRYDRYFEALTRAFDPHTNYLPPAEKEDFDISMSGSLEGIGATLREEDGYIKVVAVIPGSAAWRQGQLEAEDIILKVGEGKGEPVDITDTRIRDAVALIRGKKGTEVRLTVRKPDGTGLVVPIIRDVVQIEETFVKSAVIKDDKRKLTFGYLKIPSFYRDFKDEGQGGSGRNVTDDVRKELQTLKAQKVDGVVLDLRNNGGGALTDAVGVAGLFIKSGPIVQVRSGNGKIQVLTDDDSSVVYDGPVTVLVNEFSASASEILAGALQDYGRAVIIGGEHTHGKGTVQAIMDLDRSIPFIGMDKYQPLGALKVTIQKFYRVSGESTQYRGIVPDIVLPDRLQYLKTGEKYIDYSLPWDTVTPTPYSRWGQLKVAELKEKSRQRILADAAFARIRKETEQTRLRMENTRQSLHIDDFRKLRAEAKKMEEEGESMHGTGSRSGGKKKQLQSSEERHREWVRQVREDPYAGEAMAVLGDILRMAPATATAQVN